MYCCHGKFSGKHQASNQLQFTNEACLHAKGWVWSVPLDNALLQSMGNGVQDFALSTAGSLMCSSSSWVQGWRKSSDRALWTGWGCAGRAGQVHTPLTTSNILHKVQRVLAPFDCACIYTGAKQWQSSAADTSRVLCIPCFGKGRLKAVAPVWTWAITHLSYIWMSEMYELGIL